MRTISARLCMRLAALAGLVGLLCTAPASAGIVVVLNSADATISILDQESFQEIRRFPALREPHHLVLSPDRSTLIVGDLEPTDAWDDTGLITLSP